MASIKHVIKRALKKLLMTIGVFGYAKKINRALFEQSFFRRYGKIDRYKLELPNINIEFTTEDDYSKRWFFPRYDNGAHHEPVATQIFRERVKSNAIVFDVGANLGYFTCLASKLAPDGYVHSFEIDSNCLPLIQKNLAINSLTNVTVNNMAVSDNNQFETIPDATRPNPTLRMGQKAAGGFKKVKATTLTAYCHDKKCSPNFIKIDVEGAELKVLKGMTEILKTSGLVILMEVHVEILKNNFDSSYRDIIEILTDYNFKIREVLDHRKEGSNFREIDRATELRGNTMILAIKN